MAIVFKIHVLMALVSILSVWGRAALSFHGKTNLANHKAALLLNAGSTALLLLTALILMFNIGQYPFADGWLTEKLLLLVLYVIGAIVALKEQLPIGLRVLALAASSCVFGMIFTIAKHHVGIIL